MAKEWDKANMKTLGANMKRETAEAFQQYARSQGTTVGALLRGFVEATVEGKQVAHHNPDNYNPDQMLNAILDEYFRFVKRVRR